MYFKKSDLPMNSEMINFWNENGYLIIEDFKTNDECDALIKRSKELIDEQDFNNQQSVFDTVSQSHNDDNYFLFNFLTNGIDVDEINNMNETSFTVIKNDNQFFVNIISESSFSISYNDNMDYKNLIIFEVMN